MEENKIHELQRDVRTLKALQLGVKVLINQAYGAFGSPYFYFANRDVAATVTAQGRNLIHFSIDAVNNYFINVWHLDKELHEKLGIDSSKVRKINTNVVVYVDTDSNYVNFGALIDSVEGLKFESLKDSANFVLTVLNERFENYLDDSFNEYAKYYKVDNRMIFKMEKVCSQAIWVAKKQYAYRTIYEDYWLDNETHASGLPCTKPSYPKKSREIMWRIIDIILDKNKSIVLEKDIVPALVDEFNMFCRCDPDDICFNKYVRTINKYTALTRDYDIVEDQNDHEKYAINKNTGEYHTITDKNGVVSKSVVRDVLGEYILMKRSGGEVAGCVRYNNALAVSNNTKYARIKQNDKIKSYYINETGEMFCYQPEDFDSSVCDPIDYKEQFYRSVITPINSLLAAIGKNELTRDMKRDIKVKKPLKGTVKASNNNILEVQFMCVNKETLDSFPLTKKFNRYILCKDRDITKDPNITEEDILKFDDELSKFGDSLILIADAEAEKYISKIKEARDKKKENAPKQNQGEDEYGLSLEMEE